MKKVLLLIFILTAAHAQSQDINALLQKVRLKMGVVTDYKASGKMKTNVAFLKVPIANVSVYYKKPDKLQIKSEKGISFIPKGAVSINMNSITGDNHFTVIDAGTEMLNGRKLRIAKLLPEDDNSDVVLSTVYIDETDLVVKKAKTTTKENGTYELEMTYGKYTSFGLPDKIIFSFNTKDYKLPKGVTFDFDDGSAPVEKSKAKKGKAEIVFSSYEINKGLANAYFK